MNDVRRWLVSLGLGQYADAFEANDIEPAHLPSLDHALLKEIGVASAGHRLTILEAARAAASPERGDGALAAPSAEPERRQLTVMFCDLVGSTALSGRLDPEDLGEVMRAYQDACRRAIERYEGYVARYLGDGVLAYFGYPRAHEEDAERAVRAALDLVGAMGRLAPVHGTPLQVRIGIATGPVVAGDVVGTGASEEHAVLGETPNLAARLQARAAPGEVLIAASTRALTGDLFVYADAGRPVLKGFVEPVQIHRVLSARMTESRFAAIRSTRARPLVGREVELRLLLERWARALDAEGQVVLLSGEPGIGKSHLVHALAERLGPAAQVLRFQCSPHFSNTAFHPFIEQALRAAGVDADDRGEMKVRKVEHWLENEDDDVAASAPALHALLSLPGSTSHPRPQLSADAEKELIVRTLVERCAARARRAPLLVVFEDAHWADPTSLDVLGGIVDAAAGAPMLALVTHRPQFPAAWLDRGHVTAHSLVRLGRREVIALASGLCGGRALPEAAAEAIAARTDGVPLFVEELTKTMLEAGAIADDGSGLRLTGPLPELAVPSTLRDSLVERLDRLGPVKNVAQIASTIGREFSPALLAAVADLDAGAVDGALAQLESAELVHRHGTGPGTTYVFKHALVQDAAYDSLLKRRREALHGKVASALESRFASLVEDRPELLAHHCEAAGRTADAVGHWRAAATRALTRSAYREALAHLDAALALLVSRPGIDDAAKGELEVQVARGGVLMVSHGYVARETEEAFDRARALAASLGDSRRSFAALRGLHGVHFVRAELDTALAVAEECLGEAERAGDVASVALAQRLVGQTLAMRGELLRAREHLENALSLDGPEDGVGVTALVHGSGHRLMTPAFLAHVLWLLGEPERALELAERSLRAAERQHGVFTVTACLYFLCWLHGFRRDFEALAEGAARANLLASEHKITAWTSTAGILSDWPALAAGDPERRAELARRKLDESGRPEGLRAPFKLCILAEALAADRADCAERARETVDAAFALAERSGEHWSRAELLRVDAAVLRAGAAPAEAVESKLREAVEAARAQGALTFELRAASDLARTIDARGRRREARALLAHIRDRLPRASGGEDRRAADALLEELARP